MGVRQMMNSIEATTPVTRVIELLEHPETEEAHVLMMLRRRDLAGSFIEAIARHERWRSRRAVRRAIVSHPKVPTTLALRTLNHLLWAELQRVAGNYRVNPRIRNAAERHLRDRLAELELGERITLARKATTGLLPALLKDASPQVIAALLINPRLRENQVLMLAENRATSSDVLRAVAECDRWSCRQSVKLAVLKNTRTPVHAALRLVATLPAHTLERLVGQHQLPPVVRKGAERLLSR